MHSPFKRSDVFVVVAWVTLITGLIEGGVWTWSRAYPLLNAAHKVSPDALWVAPLLNLVCFLLASVLLVPLVGVYEKIRGSRAGLSLYGLFLFLGFYLAITAPQVIQNYGAAAMSLGLAVAICRLIGKREENLTLRLRRHIWCIPAILLVTFLGVRGWDWGAEKLRANSLPEAPRGAPNVLVLMLDTVRADRFIPLRSSTLTPNIDRIAARGVRFDNAWSTTSWSLPAQASVMTGRYAHEHETDWPTARMSNRLPTLAEKFHERGYVTGAFSGNAAWVTPEYMGRGFLRFRVYILEDLFRRTTLGRKFDKLLEKVGYHSAGRGKKAPQINREFIEFLDDYPARPFFAYLCYMDVNREMHDSRMNKHKPLKDVVADYDAALTQLDARVGEITSELERRGLLENTLLIITSDHGESFGAKLETDHEPDGHGSSLFREQSAVPLSVIFPGKVPAGIVSKRTVSIRQIPATLADLLGVAWPFPGESLSAAWHSSPAAGKSSAPQQEPSVYANVRDLDGKEIQESVIQGKWQFLFTPRKFHELQSGEQLFDNATDPTQRKNLLGEAGGDLTAAPLREKLNDFRTRGTSASFAPPGAAPASRPVGK